MERIRLGVIGAGFMGGIHAKAAAAMHGVEIAGVADVNEARASALASMYRCPSFATHAEMLDRIQLDAVLVCTPEQDHLRPACDAAQKGCHVFVEKPLAASLADADAIITACRHANVQLMVGYVLRFEACYAAMQSSIRQGDVGRVLSVYARRNTTIEEGRRLGGRTTVVNYLAVHDIDQMLWQRPERTVKSVRAHALDGRLKAEVGVSDFTWLTLQFDDDSLGIIEVGWALSEGWGGFSDVKMNVVGTDGVLSLDFNPMNLVKVTRDAGWTFPETRHWPVVNGQLGGAVHLEIAHFADCVRANRKPLIDGVEGRRSLAIAVAAEKSLLENREITVGA